jgi:hypothetical protein
VGLRSRLDVLERNKFSCAGEGQDPNRAVNEEYVEDEKEEQ